MAIFTTLVLLFSLQFTMGLSDSYTMEQRIQSLAEEVQQLKQTVATLKNVQSSVGPVAFTATLTHTLTLGERQRIIFDNAITNVGNAYDKLHGYFTAPTKGVYIFFVVITNIPHHTTNILLMKNGQMMGHALAQTNLYSMYATSTLVLSLQLYENDQIWVEHVNAFAGSELIDGNAWSLFSGHLIAVD